MTATPLAQPVVPDATAFHPPRGFAGAVVMFWGWQSNLLAAALPLALALEARHWVGTRLDLEDRDFNRLADMITILMVVVLIYWLTKEAVEGLFTFLTWMPLLMGILVVFQEFSTAGSLRYSTLFWSLRGQRESVRNRMFSYRFGERLNLLYPYLAICLLSAAIARHPWFYYGMTVILAWGLWPYRSRRYSIWAWGGLILLAAVLAHGGQMGLQRLQLKIERWVEQWLVGHWLDRDPYRQRISLGDLGRLKREGKILFRVNAADPVLLRQAAYNRFFNTTWRNRQARFTPLTPSQDGRLWRFAPAHLPARKFVRVSGDMDNGRGVLPVPGNACFLRAPPGMDISHNDYGALKVRQGPAFLTYRVATGDGCAVPEIPPEPEDLHLPKREADLLQSIAARLTLAELSPGEKIQAVERYFARHFRYSLNPAQPRPDTGPLTWFLTETQAGHCELFASASALLLRAAGIPTRYATGYAVQEYHAREQNYVVRRRHAHAWTLAFVDGAWRDVDVTPPDWGEQEARAAAWWEPMTDGLSWLRHRFSEWRWREQRDDNRELWLVGLLTVLIAILIASLLRRRSVNRDKPSTAVSVAAPRNWPGWESAWYRVEQHLARQGFARLAGETWPAWLARLEAAGQHAPPLRRAVALHTRWRFDPRGLTASEQQQLETLVTQWLADRDHLHPKICLMPCMVIQCLVPRLLPQIRLPNPSQNLNRLQMPLPRKVTSPMLSLRPC